VAVTNDSRNVSGLANFYWWESLNRGEAGTLPSLQVTESIGAPGEIRTPDLLLRRQSLYPAELRARLRRFYHLQFGMGERMEELSLFETSAPPSWNTTGR
jgi:hypothetical protein